MSAAQAGACIFVHIDPKGARTQYGAEDNARIDDGIARGLRSVRLSDVTLPDGKVLSFEVRICYGPAVRKDPADAR